MSVSYSCSCWRQLRDKLNGSDWKHSHGEALLIDVILKKSNLLVEIKQKSTVIFGSSWPGSEFDMEIDRVHSWSCYFYVQFLAPLASTSCSLKQSWKLLSYSRGPGTQITSVRGLQNVQKFMHKLGFKMSPWKDSTFSTDQKSTSIRHAKRATFKRLNKHKTRVWGSK